MLLYQERRPSMPTFIILLLWCHHYGFLWSLVLLNFLRNWCPHTYLGEKNHQAHFFSRERPADYDQRLATVERPRKWCLKNWFGRENTQSSKMTSDNNCMKTMIQCVYHDFEKFSKRTEHQELGLSGVFFYKSGAAMHRCG